MRWPILRVNFAIERRPGRDRVGINDSTHTEEIILTEQTFVVGLQRKSTSLSDAANLDLTTATRMQRVLTGCSRVRSLNEFCCTSHDTLRWRIATPLMRNGISPFVCASVVPKNSSFWRAIGGLLGKPILDDSATFGNDHSGQGGFLGRLRAYQATALVTEDSTASFWHLSDKASGLKGSMQHHLISW